jgi:hypothetical protein
VRKPAGDRGIKAARNARAQADAPAHEISDQAKSRKLRQAAGRARAYLKEIRRD